MPRQPQKPPSASAQDNPCLALQCRSAASGNLCRSFADSFVKAVIDFPGRSRPARIEGAALKSRFSCFVFVVRKYLRFHFPVSYNYVNATYYLTKTIPLSRKYYVTFFQKVELFLPYPHVCHQFNSFFIMPNIIFLLASYYIIWQ